MKLNAKDIKASKYNPRKITNEESTGLSNSIKFFDDISGITFNIRTGNLVTGHQRWKSLIEKYRDLNLKEIEINDKKSEAYMGAFSGDEYTGFSIRVVNWPEEKEKAANIAANAHTIQGKFESQSLSNILADIDLNLRTDLRLDKLELDLGLIGQDSTLDLEEEELENQSLLPEKAKITIECLYADKNSMLAFLKNSLIKWETSEYKIK